MACIARSRCMKAIAAFICLGLFGLLIGNVPMSLADQADGNTAMAGGGVMRSHLYSVCSSTADGLVSRQGDEIVVDLSKAPSGEFHFETGAMAACVGQIHSFKVLYSANKPTTRVTVEKRAFWDQKLEEISFGQGIDELVIKDEAFAVVHGDRTGEGADDETATGDRATLKSVVFPNTMIKLEIGDSAFRQAIGHDKFILSEIRFPSRASSLSIGASAFEEACTLTNDCNRTYGGSTSELKRLKFPEGITALNIGEGAFRRITTGKAGFEEIVFPSTLKQLKIGNSAFEIVSVGNRLKSLVFPSGIKDLWVGNYAFAETPLIGSAWPMSLQSVRLPEQLTDLHVGDKAFNARFGGATSNGYFRSLVIPTDSMENVWLGSDITRQTGAGASDFHWVWYGKPGTSKSLWKTDETYYVAGFDPVTFENVPKGYIALEDSVVKANEEMVDGWVFPSDARVWSSQAASGIASGGVLPPGGYSMSLPTTGYMPGFYLRGWCDRIAGSGGTASCVGQEYALGETIKYSGNQVPGTFYALWREQILDENATTYQVGSSPANPDGKDAVPIYIEVKDTLGNPYMGLDAEIVDFFKRMLKPRAEQASGSALPNIAFSDISVAEERPGTLQYKATSTEAGRANIRVAADLGAGGSDLSASGNTIASFSGGEIRSVHYSVDEAVAVPGEQEVGVDIVFLDSNGVEYPVTQEFVEGMQLSLSSELVPGKEDPNAAISPLAVDLNSVGHVTASVSALNPGQVKISAGWFLPLPINPVGNIYATFGEDTGAPESHSFAVTNDQDVLANGVDEQVLTVVLVDEDGYPIEEATGDLAVSAVDDAGEPADLSVGDFTYKDGKYTAAVTSKQGGTFTILVTYQGVPVMPVIDDEGVVMNVTTFGAIAARLTVLNTVGGVTAENYRAGTLVTFTYVIRNAGNDVLSDLSITQEEFTGVGEDGNPVLPESLRTECEDEPEQGVLPADEITCSTTYTLTQADVDNAVSLEPGPLSNTVMASARTSTGSLTTSNYATATVEARPSPGLGIEIEASEIAPGDYIAGTEIEFAFTVTNAGALSLIDPEIEIEYFDGKNDLSSLRCSGKNPLGPEGTMVCTAQYVLHQHDVDASSIHLVAKAKGNYGPGPQIAFSESKDVTVAGTNTGEITLEKTVEAPEGLSLGSEVEYVYSVTNVGPISVEDISIEEMLFTGNGTQPVPICDDSILRPADSMRCTAAYTVVQADIDQGSVENTARAQANPVNSSTHIYSNADSAELVGDAMPELRVETTAVKMGEGAGDLINYEYVVTNTGPVTLADVSVYLDEASFTGSPSFEISCPASAGLLAPKATVVCVASYSLTLEDINFGVVSSSVTATGCALGVQVSSQPSTSIVSLAPKHGLLPKTTDIDLESDLFRAGEEVFIPIDVANIGQSTLTNVRAHFSDFGGDSGTPLIECPAAISEKLDPGVAVTCMASYVLSQVDIDNGGFEYSVQATGVAPQGEEVQSVQVPGVVRGKAVLDIDVKMSSNALEPADFKAGAQAKFTITIVNSGTVNIERLAATEVNFSGSNPLDPIACEATELGPDAETKCSVLYMLSQLDVDSGGVALTGLVSAYSKVDGRILKSASASNQGTPTLLLSLDATVSRDGQSSADPYVVGDQVTFAYLLGNRGNGSLESLDLDLTGFSGEETLEVAECDASPIRLAPGEEVECRANYVLTQNDLENGSIESFAEGTMTWVGHEGSAVKAQASAKLDLAPAPEIDLVGQVALAGAKFAAGEKLLVNWQIKNSGPVRLKNVLVQQSLGTPDCPDSGSVLEVGGTVSCDYTYLITQEDVDAGRVTINGQAVASVAGLSNVQAFSDVVVLSYVPDIEEMNAVISLIMAADEVLSERLMAGDSLHYHFTVRNDGDTALSDITVEEESFSGDGDIPNVQCPQAMRLGPGESAECKATYQLTQKDIDVGRITNDARAHATAWNQGIVSSLATVEVSIAPIAELRLTKRALAVGVEDFREGNRITYTFEVENLGNVTLQDVEILEKEFSGTGPMTEISCPSVVRNLLPSMNATCTAAYRITASDVETRRLFNSAIARGTQPNGQEVQSASSSYLIGTSFLSNTGTSFLKATLLAICLATVCGIRLLRHKKGCSSNS